MWQAYDGLLHNECMSRQTGNALLGSASGFLSWLRRVVVLCVYPLHKAGKGIDVDVGPFNPAFVSLLHVASKKSIQRAGNSGEDRAMDCEFLFVGANYENENSRA